MKKARRSGFAIMSSLIGLLKPLRFEMLLAITAGVMGFISAFGLGVFGIYSALSLMSFDLSGVPFGSYSFKTYLLLLAISAFLRGVLHYVEQFFNHLIAFKILAIIRGKVFEAMRRLAPAKLETKNQGDLISLIMGDIELLEVFYAHTVSPISIAAIISCLLFAFYISIHPLIALLAITSQIVIGIVYPIHAAKKAANPSVDIRKNIGELNGEFLDKLKGVKEVIQYGIGDEVLANLDNVTSHLLSQQKKLQFQMAALTGRIDTSIMLFSALGAWLCSYLVSAEKITPAMGIVSSILIVGSFAPYISLANLGNTLTKTFACGDRVLNLLEEESQVTEIANAVNAENGDIKIDALSFSYPEENKEVLSKIFIDIKKGEALGIQGESGKGKSTLLKLMMRFWDPKSGLISINGINIKNINTESLYGLFSYMTQQTVLFTGTIRDNLLIANANASDEELYEALKKASLYNYVAGLPKKLDELVGEGGANFSGGERQRIALAMCLLADRPIFILDEPTSNIDSINEAIILRSLNQNKQGRTIITVSHRISSLSICDRIINT